MKRLGGRVRTEGDGTGDSRLTRVGARRRQRTQRRIRGQNHERAPTGFLGHARRPTLPPRRVDQEEEEEQKEEEDDDDGGGGGTHGPGARGVVGVVDPEPHSGTGRRGAVLHTLRRSPSAPFEPPHPLGCPRPLGVPF